MTRPQGLKHEAAPWQEWEDHQFGMYANVTTRQHVLSAWSILGDPKRCRDAMVRVIREWPIATAHNFTHPQDNPRSWLGAAACMLTGRTTMIGTRQAWGQLTDMQREMANRIADELIDSYRDARLTAQADEEPNLFDLLNED